MTALLVALAGGAGALARFELGTWVGARTGGTFPTGTLAVNVLGSFLAGAAWALDLEGTTARVMSVGFLGGFTTFSTWMVESGRLLEEEESPRRGILNIGLMVLGGLIGAALGAAVARLGG